MAIGQLLLKIPAAQPVPNGIGNKSISYDVNLEEIAKESRWVAEKLKANPNTSIIEIEVDGSRFKRITTVSATKIAKTAAKYLATKKVEPEATKELRNYLAGNYYGIDKLSETTRTNLFNRELTINNVKSILAAATLFNDEQLIVKCVNFLWECSYDQIETLLSSENDRSEYVDVILNLAKRYVAHHYPKIETDVRNSLAYQERQESENADPQKSADFAKQVDDTENHLKLFAERNKHSLKKLCLGIISTQINVLYDENVVKVKVPCVVGAETDKEWYHLLRDIVHELKAKQLIFTKTVLNVPKLEQLKAAFDKTNDSILSLELDENIFLNKQECQLVSQFASQLTGLKEISLWKCSIDREGLLALKDFLCKSQLEEITLQTNPLGDLCHDIIKEILSENKCLRRLDLGENDLSDKAYTSIAEALPSAKALEELYLYSNAPSEKGIITLFEALKQNPSLEVLDLQDNDVTNDALANLGDALNHNDHLIKLDLKSNLLDSSSYPAIRNIMKLARPSFETLILAHNKIDTMGGNRIAEYIAEIPHHLKYLELQGNPIPAKTQADIKKAKEKCKQLDLVI